MPVLAKAPSQENTPLASEEQLFLGQMNQLSEIQLLTIGVNKDMGATDPKPANITNTSSSSSTKNTTTSNSPNSIQI